MELIKLISDVLADPLNITSAKHITGYESAMWVERYREAGEFKIEALLSSGLKELLPPSSLISHTASRDIMIVENHEIKQPRDKDPTLIITGRGLESFMEQRACGSYLIPTTPIIPAELIITADYTWIQIVKLIDMHMTDTVTYGGYSDDNVSYLDALHTCSGVGTSEEREVEFEDLYSVVMDWLAIDDLGIKIERALPGSTNPVRLVVHQGGDRTDDVMFSWMRGDLENIEYLYTHKKYKNRARITGRWVQAVVNWPSLYSDLHRRTMEVDGREFDSQLNAAPVGAALLKIEQKMRTKGKKALASQRVKTIQQADVRNTTKYRYRGHYNVGDLVLVDGDFGTNQVMRVTEYAEITDKTGSSGHPTLSTIGDE
jgi:hypothetical protein